MGFSKRLIVVLVVLAGGGVYGGQVTFMPLRANGIYSVGERVGWRVATGEGVFHYAVRVNDFGKAIAEGDISSGAGNVGVRLDEPGMVYLEVTNGEGKKWAAGAAVSPLSIKPDVACPGDFDAFWKSKIRMMEGTAANPVLTVKDSSVANVEYATIRMDHAMGGHVWGQIARPAGGGKLGDQLPAVVIFQWASPPYPLMKNWVTDWAKRGWLALDVEPHDVPPDEPKAWYAGLPAAIKSYQTIGYESRETNYFLRMYLGDYRAVKYLESRPDWDGKTLVLMGTSMGGQQSLCVAGLEPRVTEVIVNEPSGCDLQAGLHGRAEGYPNWPTDNAKVMDAARYFDAVNFASRIRAKALVAMGFVDTTSPPAGVWAAFNQIPGVKEAAPMVDSPHNYLATAQQQAPYTDEAFRWMGELEKGGKVPGMGVGVIR